MDQGIIRHKSRVELLNRIPGGLDKSWETRRLQGLEMLGQSIEHQKERHRQKNQFQDIPSKKKSKYKKHHLLSAVPSEPCHDFQGHFVEEGNCPLKSKLHDDYVVRLEHQIQELSRQLLTERQKNRQDKLNIARLQQELARQKSERPLKETLARELEKERQIRLETEQRMIRLSSECDNYKEKLSTLQSDLTKMTEYAKNLSPYKTKYEELRRDGLTSTFEGSTVYPDDGEKTKVLLERLRMLEAEKTSLVMENEAQSQLYEKCLDEITGQVLEALMTQRNLREECSRLQNRVVDLQQQNVQLRGIFQNQLASSADILYSDHVPEEKPQLKKERVFIDDIAVSLNSLNSIFSDQDQIPCPLSHISSPAAEFRENCFFDDSDIDFHSATVTDDSSNEPVISNSSNVQRESIRHIGENTTRASDSSSSEFRSNHVMNNKNFLSLNKDSSVDVSHLPDHLLQLKKVQDQQNQGRNDSSNMPVKNGQKQVIHCPMVHPKTDGIYPKMDGIYPKMDGIYPKMNGIYPLELFETSSESDDDEEDAVEPSCAPPQLDTGSTVSLNELLDLTVTDVETETGSISYELNGNSLTMETMTLQNDHLNDPPHRHSSDTPKDDYKIQKMSNVSRIVAGQETVVSLPDVCPNQFSKNLRISKPV